jgi:hypothetical protein
MSSARTRKNLVASRLANRHIELNAQLRQRTAERIERIWRALPNHREETLQVWLNAVVPLVQGAQRAEVALTRAYIGRSLEREVVGVDADEIIANYRNGTAYEDVYTRPFQTVWTALSNGATYNEAKEQGLARATQTVATDIQLAMRDTLTMVKVK